MISTSPARSIPEIDQPVAPYPLLPSMYDLPSEFPEEPGLPDEFHDHQPHMLSRTLSLLGYSRTQWFTGTDLNIYYDVRHPLWHKRPDWFLAIHVPYLYDGWDLRESYVVWQEGQPPTIVIELLSPGTAKEDLGRFYRDIDRISDEDGEQRDRRIPSKLEVYERYLRVPHYIVYNRYTERLRYFRLIGDRYQEQIVSAGNPRIWLEDLQIGLGLWQGEFEGIPATWLRWCDQEGNWLLTDTERERAMREQIQQQMQHEQAAREQAQQQAEQERIAREQAQKELEQQRIAREQAQQQADRLAQRLRELGIDPEEV